MPAVLLDVIALWGIRNPISALSHLLGALVGVLALYRLLRQATGLGLHGRHRLPIAAYGVSIIFVFAVSTVFHTVTAPAARLVQLNQLDHSAIFVLIATTSTLIYHSLGTAWARQLVAAVWGLCLSALVIHWLFWPLTDRTSVLLYLAVGWTAVSGGYSLYRQMGLRRMRSLLAGGTVFTLGAWIFATKQPTLWTGFVEDHEVFHLLILLGVGLHYDFITAHCLPRIAAATHRRTDRQPQTPHPHPDRPPTPRPTSESQPALGRRHQQHPLR